MFGIRLTILYHPTDQFYTIGIVNDPKLFTYAYVDGGYQAHHWSVTKGSYSEVELRAVAHELFAEDYRYVQSTYNMDDGRA